MKTSFSIFGVEAAKMLSEMQHKSYEKGMEQLWTKDQFRSILAISGTTALVISKKDQPIGFILSRNVVQQVEILTFCVLPAYRKQGVGHALLGEFCRSTSISGDAEIFLEVRENNMAAIALYEKNGFTIIGRRKDYYGGKGTPHQDALVMKVQQKSGHFKES